MMTMADHFVNDTGVIYNMVSAETSKEICEPHEMLAAIVTSKEISDHHKILVISLSGTWNLILISLLGTWNLIFGIFYLAYPFLLFCHHQKIPE